MSDREAYLRIQELLAENAALQKDNDNLREAAQSVVDTIGSWMPRKGYFHYNQADDDVMKALETELSTHESNIAKYEKMRAKLTKYENWYERE